MTDVTVLGTGLMGTAIVRALLRDGRSVTVWNRSPEKAAPLVAEGAVLVDTAAEAIAASPLSFFVILSYDNVRSILEEAIEAGPMGDIVNLVTGSPSEADELEVWARAHDITMIDGALLTYPDGIGRPQCVVVYSGDGDLWTRWEPLLLSIGGSSEYLGEQLRLANAVDHVSLSFVTVAQTAMFSTLAYGEALGLPREAVMRRIERSLGTISRYLRYAEPMLESGDFHTTEATIDTWTRSSRDLAKSFRDTGLPGRAITAAAESIQAAQEAGLGTLDLAAVFLTELGHGRTS